MHLESLKEQLIWTLSFGGLGVDKITELSIDRDDNLYMAGTFENTVELDGFGWAKLLDSEGAVDIFLSKVKMDGAWF